ncbi:SspB family protein [Shimia ponticola]|uniref:SspB family protein n=1 Tax=Shimia ponticola TaxID=2582893 RepID=UPI0011BE0A6D|nr:ClpXP protease specificity-enhancing factor SspB [Shimia ponticola]
MSDSIEYGALMHRAMRSLIHNVLVDVSERGLPGNHHFFITFDTLHPDVEIADWLSDRYPGEMTVVMQHWFDNLVVEEDGFAVTLNFGDSPEALYIPFDAIKTFVDPSVEFGLRFETVDDDEDSDLSPHLTTVDAASQTPRPEPEADTAEGDTEEKSGDVVSLDSFRKS